ncbi:hypothetical protein NO1_0339 [Candidatus Termititenax aidoneus]|uniref:WG repeat-containing protein n=1 Tax=Termititenax aidoneus TaxID=2218524 RepID=A0A388T8L7_TERA1|nr:hypothetical protein NO1_0339 [Candidatus Termititenax aidoneus]
MSSEKFNIRYDKGTQIQEYKGLTAVGISSTKWKVFDEYGKQISERIFDKVRIYEYHNGLFPAIYNGKWGVISKQGKIIVNFEYDNIWFSEYQTTGKFSLMKNGKWGLVKINENMQMEIIKGFETEPIRYDPEAYR